MKRNKKAAGKPEQEPKPDPDAPYKPLGLNKLTKTSGDGEKIEQEYLDEIEDTKLEEEEEKQ